MNSNDYLVNYLVGKDYIETGRVEEAFRSVDRKEFVSRKHSENAFQDRPLPIHEEAMISAPHMVAINTELLEVESEDRVLEIGSGSGYQLAILAELSREAVGVEIVEELAEESKQNLEKWSNVEIIAGSGLEASEGSFDRILFSCAIDEKKFEEAIEKVREDGIVVAPVGEKRQVLKRHCKDEVESHGGVRFVQYRD